MNYNKNGFKISNKSCIEKQEIKSEEEIEKDELKYLYLLTGGENKLSNLKKDIGLFLMKSEEVFLGIKSLSEYAIEFGIKNRQMNLQYEKNKVKSETENLKKLKCFEDNFCIFQKRISNLRSKAIDSKKIFDYIYSLKKDGFILSKKTEIRENDEFIDPENIFVEYKLFRNFEDLFADDECVKNYGSDLEKFIFKLKKINDEEKYELSSDFYEYYSKKYYLSFELKITFGNSQTALMITNKIIDEIFKENFPLFKDNPSLMNIMSFFIKYLVYKIVKEETTILRDILLKTLKTNSFDFKGLNFEIIKIPFTTIIKCNFLNNLFLRFTVSKYQNSLITNRSPNIPPNNMNSANNKSNKYAVNNKNTINSYQDLRKFHVTKFIICFVNNILNDIKNSSVATNFIGQVKKNKNVIIEDVAKNGTIIKNIYNLSLILLRYEINNSLIPRKFNSGDYKVLVSHLISKNNILGIIKMVIESKNYSKANKSIYNVEVFFDENLNTILKIQEPYKNNIISNDKVQNFVYNKGKINFMYLFDMIKHYLI